MKREVIKDIKFSNNSLPLLWILKWKGKDIY